MEFALDAPIRDTRANVCNRLVVPRGKVKHNEACNGCALRDEVEVCGETRRLRSVVLGDGSAEHDPRVAVQPRQRKVKDFAPDVIKVHVEVAEGFPFLVEGGALVVEGFVYAKVLFEPFALVGGACDGDDFAPQALAKLADE